MLQHSYQEGPGYVQNISHSANEMKGKLVVGKTEETSQQAFEWTKES